MKRPIIAAIVGTSFMTAFSYWKARKKNRQFEEPKMLGKFIHRAAPDKVPPEVSLPAGWLLHYGIGLAFNSLYHQWWKRKSVKPGIKHGLVAGAPSGVIGILGWHSVFKLHSSPPQTHLGEFYKQLFTAHLIFGVASALAYQKCEP